MERIPRWLIFWSCDLMYPSLLHLIAMLDTVTSSALLKSIFSKTLVISLTELFQTSASSQNEVTVSRFTLLPEITENWMKYMKHCFSRHCVTVFHEKICWSSTLHPAYRTDFGIGRSGRELIFHHLSGKCKCCSLFPTRIVLGGLEANWVSISHLEAKRLKEAVLVKLVTIRIYISLLHISGKKSLHPTWHQ